MEVITTTTGPQARTAYCVLSFQGYNMEDAVSSTVHRWTAIWPFHLLQDLRSECRQYLEGSADKFEIPEAGPEDIEVTDTIAFLRKMESSRQADVSGNTVLVGRTSPPRFLEEYREFEVKGPTKRDSSVGMRPSEVGVVDTIFVTESIEGSKLVKVKIRDTRVPELGDKVWPQGTGRKVSSVY